MLAIYRWKKARPLLGYDFNIMCYPQIQYYLSVLVCGCFTGSTTTVILMVSVIGNTLIQMFGM